ncbi:universal stress protein [Halobacteriales archaeon Cl-PHB]
MYTILLGIDRNVQRARAQAAAVVDMPCAEEQIHAVVLHDFTNNPEGASANRVSAVRDAQEILEDAGISTDLRETSGDPGDEILTTAEEVDADMIAVAGRKRSPTGKVLFGSITQTVILQADRPVLVVDADEDEGPE